MAAPPWLTRKLWQKGSLQETRDGITFVLRNVLGDALLVAPPRVVVNGVFHPPETITARRRGGDKVDVAGISPETPLEFPKGSRWRLWMPGRVLLGPNRVQIVVQTEDQGELEIFVEDQPMGFCDLTGEEE